MHWWCVQLGVDVDVTATANDKSAIVTSARDGRLVANLACMSAAPRTDSSTPEDGIHKCDTVPPPDGEADAYNAPTKIGDMARGVVDQLMAQAEAMTGQESLPPKSGERP